MSDPNDVSTATGESPPLYHRKPSMMSCQKGDASCQIRPQGDVTTTTELSDNASSGGAVEQEADDVDVTTPKEVIEAGIAGALVPEYSTQSS